MSPLTFLIWLALVWGAGIAAFPLARRAFAPVASGANANANDANASGADLPDAGLAVGRILFLASWTMLAFWLGQFGVPVALCAWLVAPLAALGVLVGWRDRAIIQQIWREQRRAILATEAIFLAVFLGFFLLRGFWSNTNGDNGEKSMDSALIGSLARAQHLPPETPYAAGARLNSYYSFGHLQTALLTRASNTSVRWSYNLMCATLPALCFAGLFSLGGALTGGLRGGLWVASAVLAGGTLQPLYQWTQLDFNAAGNSLLTSMTVFAGDSLHHQRVPVVHVQSGRFARTLFRFPLSNRRHDTELEFISEQTRRFGTGRGPRFGGASRDKHLGLSGVRAVGRAGDCRGCKRI